jgi:hypothetical protein
MSTEFQVLKKLKASVPSIDAKPSAFVRAFPKIHHHGYLLVKDARGEWALRYVVLLNKHIQFYNSHHDAPTTPISECDLDSSSMTARLADKKEDKRGYRGKLNSSSFDIRVNSKCIFCSSIH